MSKTEAESYVKLLLTEGAKTICDEDNYELKLPVYADEKKIRKGQLFSLFNAYAVSFNISVALMLTVAIESLLRIFVFTKKSSDVPSAYKRFKLNVLHTQVWFRNPLKPGTKAWESIQTVRRIHVNRNAKTTKAGVGSINQKDLALVQMAMVGFAMSDPEKCGFQGSPEQFECYNHLWRVIGHLLGIKEKFNFCGETAEITKHRMNAIKKHILIPAMKNPPEQFDSYSRTAIEGMSYFNPFLEYESALYYGKRWMGLPDYYYFSSEKISKDDSNTANLEKLRWFQRFRLFWSIVVLQYFTKVWILKWIVNINFIIVAKFLDVFPILAINKFGSRRAFVKIYYDMK